MSYPIWRTKVFEVLDHLVEQHGAPIRGMVQEWCYRRDPNILSITINMVLHCPVCGAQHIDAPEPENGWTNPPHKSHLCHNCGCIWRPASVATNGVAEVERGSNDTWPKKITP